MYATPALVKERPEPVKRIFGNLGEAKQALLLVGVFGEE
ncbi:MAG: circadian clock KaiB family protein [Sedimenticola sp.]